MTLDTDAAVPQRDSATGDGASLGSLGGTPNDPTPRPYLELLRPDYMVEVLWWDSEHVNLGWADPSDYIAALHDRSLCRTLGYVIERTDDHVMLAMSRTESGNVTTCMVIPIPMIRNVLSLR